jgi:DNA-binding transcriptional MerR regulator
MTKSTEAFRTISEVAEVLDTPAHVLRFWESRFPQVKPVKRAGGRRYYRPGDVALLAGIRKLLHEDGLTIRGVQKMLRERGVRHVAEGYGLDSGLDGAGWDAAGALPPTQADLPQEEIDVTDMIVIDATSREAEAPGARARAAIGRKPVAPDPVRASGDAAPAASLVRALSAGRAAQNRAALADIYRRLQALHDARWAAGQRPQP